MVSMFHLDDLPAEVKLLIISYAPELSTASKHYYYLRNNREPNKLSKIEMLPKDIKIRLLSLAPNLRFASAEWYCLHNELYRQKCQCIYSGKWTYKHLKIAQQVRCQCQGTEPLRKLCLRYSARTCSSLQDNSSVLPYFSDSWHYIYENILDYHDI
ncbi:HHL254Cp [Eremothecium sinecaudum]|uniref:HHL254Cp n=1 Tax=Eremothecium sinecaudum TaxID=45286 RepID=A0A109UYC2_9SACH|nr:HHL254Cp [Eremothecium sinecaudum]AMD22516.1 HHL254Cp [Eremothecium sinecaudum]